MNGKAIQILISGTGSNSINIIQACQTGLLRGIGRVSQVLSNKPAPGLDQAQTLGVTTTLVDETKYQSTSAFEHKLIDSIEQQPCDLLVLAGFMRILSAEFVAHFAGRIINIHPSLLPRFKGLNTHQRALDANDRYHGTTVHLVIPDLDAGPVIAQAQLNIDHEDTAKTLKKRVQALEYKLYPWCIKQVLSGAVHLSPDTVKWSPESNIIKGKTLWTEHDMMDITDI